MEPLLLLSPLLHGSRVIEPHEILVANGLDGIFPEHELAWREQGLYRVPVAVAGDVGASSLVARVPSTSLLLRCVTDTRDVHIQTEEAHHLAEGCKDPVVNDGIDNESHGLIKLRLDFVPYVANCVLEAGCTTLDLVPEIRESGLNLGPELL